MGVLPTASLMLLRGGPYPSPRALALILVAAGLAVPTLETISRSDACSCCGLGADDTTEEEVGPRKADTVVADAPRRNNFIANFMVELQFYG